VSFGVFLLGAVALFAAAVSGQTGGETLFDNPWLGFPGALGLVGAITSMVSGLVALFGRRERSVIVVLAATVSTMAFLFVALSLLLG
jgi:hypothetical protein